MENLIKSQINFSAIMVAVFSLFITIASVFAQPLAKFALIGGAISLFLVIRDPGLKGLKNVYTWSFISFICGIFIPLLGFIYLIPAIIASKEEKGKTKYTPYFIGVVIILLRITLIIQLIRRVTHVF